MPSAKSAISRKRGFAPSGRVAARGPVHDAAANPRQWSAGSVSTQNRFVMKIPHCSLSIAATPCGNEYRPGASERR